MFVQIKDIKAYKEALELANYLSNEYLKGKKVRDIVFWEDLSFTVLIIFEDLTTQVVYGSVGAQLIGCCLKENRENDQKFIDEIADK